MRCHANGKIFICHQGSEKGKVCQPAIDVLQTLSAWTPQASQGPRPLCVSVSPGPRHPHFDVIIGDFTLEENHS